MPKVLDEEQNETVEDSGFDLSRRKAMCKIAVGVGVVAGMSVLPEQWTKPIIGQIVLPAHAATSGVCSANSLIGVWTITTINGRPNEPLSATFNSNGTISGNGINSGSWSLSGNTATMALNVTDSHGDIGEITMTGTLGSDCRSMSGSGVEILNSQSFPGTFTATKS